MKKLDYEEVTKKICNFLKIEFRKRNKTKAVLGVSGGIDSAVAAFLCKKTGLDLYAVILPYRKSNIEASRSVVSALKLPKNRIVVVDIGPAVDVQIKALKKVMKLDRIDIGNIMARQRMIIQYALAKRLGGLVVGTENLSEYYLGYFTLFGDQACDISVISGLWKTQVCQLADYLGISKEIIERIPTAGLWQGQTDEKEFGFTYKDADKILYFSIIKKYPVQKIIKKSFNKRLINKVLERVEVTKYKRQNLPKILFNK